MELGFLKSKSGAWKWETTKFLRKERGPPGIINTGDVGISHISQLITSNSEDNTVKLEKVPQLPDVSLISWKVGEAFTNGYFTIKKYTTVADMAEILEDAGTYLTAAAAEEGFPTVEVKKGKQICH